MKTLDRYINRQFLINFGILFLVLMTLFVVVDLLVDLDEFLQAGQAHADQFGSAFLATIWTIIDYYGPTVVLMYVFFSGLLVVGAMGFTLSALQRNRELTAVVSSGISMYRIASPVLVMGIVLNALTLPCQEWLIPVLAPKLARAKPQLKDDAIHNFPVRYATDEHGNLLSAAEFDAATGMLSGVTIDERDSSGLAARHISATQAQWEDEPMEGWRLITGFATTPGEDLGIRDAEEVTFFPTRLSPTVLLARRATIYPTLLPMSELQQMQSNAAVDPLQKDRITQIIWSRFSLLVLNVLILVMGLPFFLLRGPANLLLQAVKAAGVCLGAWGAGLMLLQVSSSMLNPVAAAWLPVVIYLPVSAILLQFVKT